MEITYFTPKDGDVASVEMQAFAKDIQKMNLTWLVEPRLDTEGLSCLTANKIALGINKHMDKATRNALRGTPTEFMLYWNSVDEGCCALAEDWPNKYLTTMRSRARAWGKPVVESDNIIRVNFRMGRG